MLQIPHKRLYDDFMYAYEHWLDAVASEPEGSFSEEALNWEALIIKRCKEAALKHMIPPWLTFRRVTRGVESETFIGPDSETYWRFIKEYLEDILLMHI